MKNVVNILKKALKIVSDVSFILLVAYFIVFIPALFGFNLTTVVKDYNDVPYKSGSLIYYKRGVIAEYHKNDYILYGSEKSDMHIYKIKNVDNGYLYITDDGNVKYKIKEIKGKIAPLYVPYYGRYIAFINNNQIILYILCGIVIIDFILGSIITDFKNTYKNIKKEEIEELD